MEATQPTKNIRYEGPQIHEMARERITPQQENQQQATQSNNDEDCCDVGCLRALLACICDN